MILKLMLIDVIFLLPLYRLFLKSSAFIYVIFPAPVSNVCIRTRNKPKHHASHFCRTLSSEYLAQTRSKASWKRLQCCAKQLCHFVAVWFFLRAAKDLQKLFCLIINYCYLYVHFKQPFLIKLWWVNWFGNIGIDVDCAKIGNCTNPWSIALVLKGAVNSHLLQI